MLGVIVGLAGTAMRGALKNPLAIISLVLAIAIGMIFVSKNAQIHELNRAIHDPKTGYVAKVDGLTVDLTTSRNNVTTLQHTLDVQSAGLKALNDRALEANSRSDAMMAELRRTSATTSAKIKALDAAQPGADKCVSAFALVRSVVK